MVTLAWDDLRACRRRVGTRPLTMGEAAAITCQCSQIVRHDQSCISNIENGRMNPAYGTVDRIARALRWPLSRLVALAESVETEGRKPLDLPLRDQRTSQ